MGFLNDIFEKKKTGSSEDRLIIWQRYLDSYIQKKDLAMAMLDSDNPIKLAGEIEILIPKELVDIILK